MIVVGMDVHVRNSFLLATDQDGRRLAKGRRANGPADLAAFCDQVLAAVGGRLQPMEVVLESTTNSRLRCMLTEAAWMAVNRVPQCSTMFERVAERRGKAVAIVGIARRMLEDAVTMLWKDEAFRFVPAGAIPPVGAPSCDPSALDRGQDRKVQAPANARVASSVAG